MTSDQSAIDAARSLFQSGDIQAAYDSFLRASYSTASDPEITLGLALCLTRLGRHEEAERQWAHVARNAPALYRGVNQLHHVDALIETDRLDEARALLKACDPAGADGGRMLGLVRKLAEREARAPDEQGTATADRQKDNSFTTGYRGGAATIVSSNAELTDRYAGLIGNEDTTAQLLAFKNVIVVTYGRTGSTLLQGMLNTIPGLRFLGENEGAFFHLFDYVETVEALSRRKDGSLPTSPHFGAGALDPTAARVAARSAINAFFAPAWAEPGVVCVGFKDVRYIDHPDRLGDYLTFLEEMFDAPAFVFLWRNHDEVLRSGWWKQTDRIKAADILATLERQAGDFARDRGNCFAIDYADLSGETGRLDALFTFLGATPDQEKISAIRSIPHSYNPERTEVRDLFEKAKRQ